MFKGALLLAVLGTAVAVSGCDGKDGRAAGGGDGGRTVALSGVAAIGAPLAGAVVDLRCEGGDFSTSTNAQGAWSVEVPEGAAPCLIRASGGTPPATLYSYAAGPGSTNITPFTTLAVARAVAASSGVTSLDSYFAQATVDPAGLAGPALDAGGDISDALLNAGYSLPDDFDAFRSPFSATPGDPHDDLLEAFAAALDRDGQSFEDFVEAYVGNAPLPSAEATEPGDGGGEPVPVGPGDEIAVDYAACSEFNATTWLACSGAVIPDISIQGLRSVGGTLTDQVCTLTKIGDTMTVSSGADSVSATFTSEMLEDSVRRVDGRVVVAATTGDNVVELEIRPHDHSSDVRFQVQGRVSMVPQIICFTPKDDSVEPTDPPPPDDESFSIGGSVSGLEGTVVLQNNGSDDLGISSNGGFSFGTKVEAGGAYNVTVLTQPVDQTCVVGNGSGTANADVSNVTVNCETDAPEMYSIGGSASGLDGTVVLQNNGGDDLSISSNGGFSFGTKIEAGGAYSVTVLTQPADQTCTVGNGNGTVGGADINNVSVDCVTNETDPDPDPGTDFYALLNDQNGILLQPNGSGHAYLLRGANAAGQLANDMRRLRFGFQTGTWDDVANVDMTPFNGAILVSVQMDVGIHKGLKNCGTNAVITVALQGTAPWTGNFTASSCEIRMDHGSKFGGMAGVILGATLSNAEGTASFTLQNAPFRVYRHVGEVGEPPVDFQSEAFASLYIETPGVFEFPGDQHFLLDNGGGFGRGTSPDDGTPPFTGNASDRITLTVPNVLAAIGTTGTCNTMRLGVGTYQAGLSYRADAQGGACSYTVTERYGNFVALEYTATLITSIGDTDPILSEAERTVQVRGVARNYMLRPVRPGGDGDEAPLGDEAATGLTITIEDGTAHFIAGDRFRKLHSNASFDPSEASGIVFGEPPVLTVSSTRAVGGQNWGIEIMRVPAAPGVYTCGAVPAGNTQATRVMLGTGQGLNYQTAPFNTNPPLTAGASCTVTIDSVEDGVVSGSYEAVLVGEAGSEHFMPDGDNVVGVSGEFRYTLP